MKQFLSAAMCAAVLVSLLLLPARAAGAPDIALKAAAEMGVLPQGQTRLDLPVKRGEFAKMLVAASPLKGTVSPAGNASPYRDVTFTHVYASYIKTAVQKGWLRADTWTAPSARRARWPRRRRPPRSSLCWATGRVISPAAIPRGRWPCTALWGWMTGSGPGRRTS